MGKPNALNTGIAQSSGDIVLTVDADTTLHKDALSKIAVHFAANPKIGAIAGNVKIKNEHSIINVLQSAEYATGINLVRKAQSVLGCVLVVPGPIAAIRREVIQRSGGFSDETFAEDFDMTLAILKAGYRIEYVEDSLAYTDAPKNTQDLIKQRRRWYRGMIQVLDKYKSMYLNPKYGLAGTVGIPNLWLEAVSPFINLSLLLLILFTWALYRTSLSYRCGCSCDFCGVFRNQHCNFEFGTGAEQKKLFNHTPATFLQHLPRRYTRHEPNRGNH